MMMRTHTLTRPDAANILPSATAPASDVSCTHALMAHRHPGTLHHRPSVPTWEIYALIACAHVCVCVWVRLSGPATNVQLCAVARYCFSAAPHIVHSQTLTKAHKHSHSHTHTRTHTCTRTHVQTKKYELLSSWGQPLDDVERVGPSGRSGICAQYVLVEGTTVGG